MLAVRAGLDLTLRWLTFGLTALLLVCVVLGALTRTLNDPLIWTDEVSRILMVWVAAFGWMLVSRRRVHIRIRFFHDLLPRRLHWLAEILIQCAILILGVLLFFYSIELVVRNHDLQALTVPVSMSWLYLPMVFAGLLTAGQAGVEVVEVLRHANTQPPGENFIE